MKKILVIDDDPQMRKMLVTRLGKNGYLVEAACDGVEGLEKWKTFKPNLIILDVCMPNMDGFSFVQESKANEEIESVPIIVLTSREEMVDIFAGEGVSGYLIKPYNEEEMLEKIESCLS
ncbi:MAG: response regulator [Candidatus Omnitrophica bacterium]|nr:response regulator [Candidatus Omnitrophota bacterium]MBU1996268.1 response regulator [Candidatus Omnitrophota bacterium]MBU4334524.1 response regulator [Candidatus Omnitrophota bacterium]